MIYHTEGTHNTEVTHSILPKLIAGQDYTEVFVLDPNNPDSKIPGHLLTPQGTTKLQTWREGYLAKAPLELPLENTTDLKQGDVIKMPLSLAVESYLRRNGGNLCNFREGYQELADRNSLAVVLNSPELDQSRIELILLDWDIAPFIGLTKTFHEFVDRTTKEYIKDINPSINQETIVRKSTYRRGDFLTPGIRIHLSAKTLQTGQSDQPLSEWMRNLCNNNLRRKK